MVYQFQPDDSGAVVAESRSDDLEPFLDLHYPASDIPQQARAMYLRNWLRLIPDARHTPMPLVPQINPISGRPLDLTYSVLRSVSPLHLEYLANMGVVASMSLSLVVEGKLWGLIACHHRQPKHLPHVLRATCELFAQVVSLQLSDKLGRQERAGLQQTQAIHGELVKAMSEEESFVEALIEHQPNLIDYIPADGVVIWSEGKAAHLGRTPDHQQTEALVGGWLNDSVPLDIFATDCLAKEFPPAAAYEEVASGLMALSVSRTPRDYVLWFRSEMIGTITWAGNPDKPAELGDDGLRLSPRKSFVAWRETVLGHSRPWTPSDREAAQALRTSILEVVLHHVDLVARERERARARQEFLIAELDHRVKNTLATVQAITTLSARHSADLEDFLTSFMARIQALGSTHALLSRENWRGVRVRDIAAGALAGFGGDRRIRIHGGDATLKPKPAHDLALALHELATNAAKYGSLSVKEGRVELRWWLEERRLLIEWRELNGPRVAPPATEGPGNARDRRGGRP